MQGRDEWTLQVVRETAYRNAPAHGYRPGTRIRVKAGLHWLGGNERPHWSITAAIGTARELRTGDWQSGGCCHEDILRHWPQLAPIVALHLSDDTGAPMRAAANAVYHAGRSKRFGRHGDESAYYEPNADHLRNHLRITAEQARQLIEEAPTGAAIVAFVETQRERWQAESAAGEALLRAMLAEQQVTA